MGCTNSKIDRLPAVSLCRDRCHSLDDALRQSYALADAHVAYLHSLRALGGSLGRFVSSRPATEVESLRRDHGETPKHPLHPASPRRSSSSSTSGSHIHFNSDSDYDDRRKMASTSSRLGHIEDYYNPAELSISYQRSQPAQSSMYIQPIYDTYLNQAITTDSGLKPQQPAPLPPPPSNSAWDFLNLFDSDGAYEHSLVSSGRRVKTFNSDMDLMSTTIPTVTAPQKIVVSETEKNKSEITTAKREKSVSINSEKVNFPESSHDEGGKYLTDVMKEVESLFEKASDSGTGILGMLNNAKFRHRPKSCAFQVPSKVSQAISSSYAKLCLKQGKKATYSSDTTIDHDLIVGSEEDAMAGSGNFTSVMNKLYMWEKKLYTEVKDEEMLRILYSKKCKELQHLLEMEKEELGDAGRIEFDYALIQKLSTKLKISLHVIETISARIAKLRDEELHGCLCKLIHGWREMWRIMEDCHRRQSKAIAGVKAIDTILSNQRRNYDFEHLDAAMLVKLDLQSLELCFCNWVIAQKGFIKALDCWLAKWLSNGREGPSLLPETGVPDVFVVSRQWMHDMDMSWVIQVTGTMSELVGSIGCFCDDSNASLHAKAQEDKELELKMKALERKDSKMRGEIHRAIKRGVIPTTVAGLGINDGELGGMSRVRPRLENMFEAMAKYSANCVETYEELSKFCDEKRIKEA